MVGRCYMGAGGSTWAAGPCRRRRRRRPGRTWRWPSWHTGWSWAVARCCWSADIAAPRTRTGSTGTRTWRTCGSGRTSPWKSTRTGRCWASSPAPSICAAEQKYKRHPTTNSQVKKIICYTETMNSKVKHKTHRVLSRKNELEKENGKTWRTRVTAK